MALRRVPRLPFVEDSCDLITASPNLGTTIAARRARMATTIISSIRVNPAVRECEERPKYFCAPLIIILLRCCPLCRYNAFAQNANSKKTQSEPAEGLWRW